MLPFPRHIASFSGGVSCEVESDGPIGLTLSGRTADRPNERVSVDFSTAPPAGFPQALEDVTVAQLDPGTYRVTCADMEWMVSASAVHVHRQVAAAFYRVVVPREPGLGKRMFWSAVLALARHPMGRRLLFALRRR